MNDADTKHLFDNRFGTGTVDDRRDHAVDEPAARRADDRRVRYGMCGRGVASRASGMGAHVIVTEVGSD